MTEDRYPSEKADRFMVRLPDGMRDRLKEEAKKHNRTMNAEVVSRLERSFEMRPLIELTGTDGYEKVVDTIVGNLRVDLARALLGLDQPDESSAEDSGAAEGIGTTKKQKGKAD